MTSFAATAGRISVNEKEFIVAALKAEQRIDGRRPFDARPLTITFAKQDGAVEVQQGETRVMAVVTGQLGSPYPDRPTEGSLLISTELSPMADPTFEPGRPGEMAIELGRIIDRGLRESRAVDTESLCVLAGRAVWALRLDIHILDNGGNLIDVANLAALAALKSYRRPECTIGGESGQDVIVHPSEVKEPASLIIHHLPIAITFAFFSDGDLLVVDPSLKEEAVMGGRLTVTVNTQGDICAIQKGGGVGVSSAEIMRCVRIAASKASEVTNQLNREVEAHDLERNLRKIKRHPNRGKPIDTPVVLAGDSEMDGGLQSDVAQDEQRKALMETVRAEEMAESSSSESDEGEDLDDSSAETEETRQSLRLDRRTASATDGLINSWGQIHGGGMLQSAPFVRAGDMVDQSAMQAAQRPLDSDKTDSVADAISMSTTSSVARVNAEGGRLSGMSAAVVYAQMPEQGNAELRPLGPVFPGADNDQERLAAGALAGHKTVPTSLLDAVKKKRKKGGTNRS